jgi:hypothetical protein
MKTQFDNNLMPSFYLWLDNRICNHLEAVSTGQYRVFNYSSGGADTPSGRYSFYYDGGQICADSTKYSYPSQVLKNGSGINITGLVIDHNQPRIIAPKSMGTGSMSGLFNIKEISLYNSDETEEEIILNKSFVIEGGKKYLESVDALGKRRYSIPCVFISYGKSENVEFALGGLSDTKSIIKATIFAENSFQLDAVMSNFRDASDACLDIIPSSGFPYGRYWNLKNSGYAYSQYSRGIKIDDCCVEEADVYKLKEKFPKIRKDMVIGFADFKISTIREAN